jgi:hypothetical protein
VKIGVVLAALVVLLAGCRTSDQTGYDEGLTDSSSDYYEQQRQDAYDQARDDRLDYEIRQYEENK